MVQRSETRAHPRPHSQTADLEKRSSITSSLLHLCSSHSFSIYCMLATAWASWKLVDMRTKFSDVEKMFKSVAELDTEFLSEFIIHSAHLTGNLCVSGPGTDVERLCRRQTELLGRSHGCRDLPEAVSQHLPLPFPQLPSEHVSEGSFQSRKHVKGRVWSGTQSKCLMSPRLISVEPPHRVKYGPHP